MNRCECRQGNSRKAVRAASFLLSGLTLLLMPKCPACLAAYVVLLTGISVSATAARHLQTGLWAVSSGALVLLAWQGVALFCRGRMAARSQRKSAPQG